MKEQASVKKRPEGKYRMPWWLSVVLAIASYCTFKYLVPGIHFENPSLQNLTQAAPSFAPLSAIPFLLLAAKQLYDTDIVAQNEQESPDQAKDNEQKRETNE